MALFESIVLGKAHISGDTVAQFVDEALAYNLATLSKEQISIVNIIAGQAGKIAKPSTIDASFTEKVKKLNESLIKYRF